MPSFNQIMVDSYADLCSCMSVVYDSESLTDLI